jgi:putative ABC transport system substrate-binding protein
MTINIGRREFISVLGGTAAALPLAARAQQPSLPVVGVLGSGNNPVFIQAIAEAGYEDNRDVHIEINSASARYDDLRTAVQDMIGRRVAVIAPFGINAAKATKEATSTIPIVFVVGVDPIKFGLVDSLNRPGGNITGMSLYTSELHAKRVDLLDKLIPAGAPIGMIINPKMPDTGIQEQNAEAAAREKGHPLIVVKASSEDELGPAFATIAERHVAGVLAVSDNFLNSQRDRIIALAVQYSVPMMYPFRADAAAGGLLSYGTDLKDVFRQAGNYVGRILKGDKPGDLPVQQPSKFELVINLKTAKTLGLEIPPNVLSIADEVIE